MLRNIALLLSAVLLAVAIQSPSFAQDAAPLAPLAPVQHPYQALGAPVDPKVQVRWNMYHDYRDSVKLFKDLAAAYPKFAKLESLGPTYDKREMWVLTVTNFEKGDPNKKPGMWIDGAIHANEIQATEVVLYTGWFLLESREQNPEIAKLLDERVFYLMPMMSPDSRDAHFYKPNTTHSPRSGQRPIDDDRDGLVNEDGPDDLDRDGSITQMRVKDPNGGWKPHPQYPELLVRVKDDEKGEYRLLGTEGFDNDGDGDVNEDGDGFYDPNRDWGWNWQPGYIQNGAYRYPFSIMENRLVADFIASRPNICGAQSYHNAGGMILHGPGVKDDKYEDGDLQMMSIIGKKGEQMLPGYRYMNIAVDLYEVFGGSVDWLYQNRGVTAFTNECFTGFNYFRAPSEGWFGSNEDTHKFNRLLMLGEGFAKWREVDHPQYGKIEVGGLKKSWSRQPPTFLLEEECHRNMAFTLYHADQLPLIGIQSAKVVDLGGGLSEVTAVVENPKVVPSRLAVDVKRGISTPDLATITAPKDAKWKVVTGLIADEPYFRRPKEQRIAPETLKLDSIPGRGVVYLRWIVQGAGPFTVSVTSVKGGSASAEAK